MSERDVICVKKNKKNESEHIFDEKKDGTKQVEIERKRTDLTRKGFESTSS